MKSTKSLKISAVFAAVLAVGLVSGCASTGQQGYTSSQSYPSQGSGQYATTSYGSIDSIQVVSGGNGATGGGAVIGGLLGNQVGGGSGKSTQVFDISISRILPRFANVTDKAGMPCIFCRRPSDSLAASTL